ncbi:MAG TPA: hypothetical protein VMS86_10790 [Thermoanaerobaculia bacterium]|nr:hypothetical protein [Thermoanaerobaculia bacterium]
MFPTKIPFVMSRDLPHWPAYTDEERAVMLFDSPCRVEQDPAAKLRELLLPGAASRGRGPFAGGPRSNGPGLWLRMQVAHDLWHAEHRQRREIEKIPARLGA